ncbi:MAG: hypothetical protein M1404_07750 [Acidobacteria bacterium]|nr:hypothetical protein [Acidobacteriota bacterium]
MQIIVADDITALHFTAAFMVAEETGRAAKDTWDGRNCGDFRDLPLVRQGGSSGLRA